MNRRSFFRSILGLVGLGAASTAIAKEKVSTIGPGGDFNSIAEWNRSNPNSANYLPYSNGVTYTGTYNFGSIVWTSGPNVIDCKNKYLPAWYKERLENS